MRGRGDALLKIILQVLKKMDGEMNKRGMPHPRWALQEEVCKKYMEFWGMAGYDPERMSENINDHPEWEDNPRFNDFFVVERSTDLEGAPYHFLRNAPSFSEAFFDALVHLAEKGLVTLDMHYERNKVGCCGVPDTKRAGVGSRPRALKDIQKIRLSEVKDR